jgi:hypothetical protein
MPPGKRQRWDLFTGHKIKLELIFLQRGRWCNGAKALYSCLVQQSVSVPSHIQRREWLALEDDLLRVFPML